MLQPEESGMISQKEFKDLTKAVKLSYAPGFIQNYIKGLTNSCIIADGGQFGFIYSGNSRHSIPFKGEKCTESVPLRPA